MDIKEVIYDLEYLISNNCTYTQIIDYVEEIEFAIKALEKQIPKKPIDDGAFCLCPICNTEFNSELHYEYEIKFCPYCGQALDWSDYVE